MTRPLQIVFSGEVCHIPLEEMPRIFLDEKYFVDFHNL